MSRDMVVRNPRTGRNDYSIQSLDVTEVEQITDNLRAAHSAWFEVGVEHRCKIVRAWADSLQEQPDAILEALTADTGRHLVSLVEIRALNRIVSGWCAIAPGMLADGDERPSETNGVGVCSQFVPYELIGIISPWNFPFLLSMLDAIPALIAGCSVIVKPSEVTPRFIKPLIRSLAAFPGPSPRKLSRKRQRMSLSSRRSWSPRKGGSRTCRMCRFR